MDRTLINMRRRLERWELLHLREHAAELANKIDELEAQVAALEARLAYAEDLAESWRRDFMLIEEELLESGSDRCIGLTQGGSVVLVERGAA